MTTEERKLLQRFVYTIFRDTGIAGDALDKVAKACAAIAQEEIDKARKEGFYAGREGLSLSSFGEHIYNYQKFEDYLKTIKP